jgi:hypothetical protein
LRPSNAFFCTCPMPYIAMRLYPAVVIIPTLSIAPLLY